MTDPLLSLENVDAGYGDLRVLDDISLHVDDGEFVSIVGPNGAGKSTLLKTIVGGTTMYSGVTQYDSADISKTPRHKIIDDGVGYVPQEDAVFPDLTVWENLQMGGYTNRSDIEDRVDQMYDLFPKLEKRSTQTASTLSGGERRMLAVARALMPDPNLLLIDEPSSGLAPQIVDRMFDRIEQIHGQGKTILLVEQDVSAVVQVSERVYTLKSGSLDFEGTITEFNNSEKSNALGW